MVEKSKKSEIIQEMEENMEQMEELIAKNNFTVKDAQRFLVRYYNIHRRMEQLVISRDNWRSKYWKLKGV